MDLYTKPQVLVVDDDPRQLAVLAEILEPRFDVIAVDDPAEAERRLDEVHELAVILTDQVMPRVTGTDLLQRARERSHATRLLMTGYDDLEALARAINDGRIFGFIRKPIEASELVRLFHHAADNFRLRRELDLERRLLQTLLDSSPDWVAFKDRDRRFLRASRTCREMLGVGDGADDPVGRREEEIARSERPADLAEVETAVLESGQPSLDRIERVATVAGEERWQSVSRAPLLSADGTLLGLVEIGRDVTDRKRLEEQFVHSQRMEAVGRLAGGVAHDFNNLLTGIRGFADLVVARGRLGEADRPDLGQVAALVDRGAALTRKLLAVSRRQALCKKRLDVRDQLREAAAILERLLGEDVRLELALPPEPLWIEVDPPQLDQVLMNLAINARDAMPRGGRLGILAAGRTVDGLAADALHLHPGTYVRITVRDTGHGIPAEALPRIFEPFFTTKAESGTGLGLSTAYGIVRQHRGAIEVTSSTAHGTTFTVLLPEVAPPSPDAVAAAPRPAARPRCGDSQRILLVEDNEPIRRVLAHRLQDSGYRVVACATAAEAHRAAAEHLHGVDLLVTDIGLPDQRGGSLYRELLREQPDLPVIFITGYLGDTTADMPAITPLTHFLAKPFTAQALLERIAAVLGEADEA